MGELFIRLSNIEVREGDGKPPVIAGHAALFGQYSETMRTASGRLFREKIAPTAFDRSLQQNDIAALWQHTPAWPLASTRNNTLRLWRDDQGLAFEMEPNARLSWGKDAVEAVRSGLVDSMSFGFSLKRGGFTETRNEDGVFDRTLTDIDLREISPVLWAAYPGTHVQVRTAGSADIDIEEDENDTDGLESAEVDSDSDVAAARARLQAMTETEIQLAARLIRDGE